MLKITYRVIKRILDLFISIFLFILFSPLMLVISIAIKVYDGGEVFLSNPKRLGVGGKEFFMYKFRTMVPDAHLSVDRDELFKNHKIEEDYRVTRIGRILRNTDMDELPQLINIIIGDMSMVGPRPYYAEEIKYHLKKFPKDKVYFKNILSVKPGLTGIWQISGRNSIPFRDRLRMESDYSLHYNIFNDIYILLKTPFVVLSRYGVKGKNV